MFKKYLIFIPIFLSVVLTLWIGSKSRNQEKGSNTQKVLIFVILYLGFLILSYSIIKSHKLQTNSNVINQAENMEDSRVISENNEPIIGGDKDEGGCLIGAGYTWCEVKQKCLRTWEEPCEVGKTDSEQIKNLLVTKHGWISEDITITISKNDGVYATGGVGASTPQGGGGIWFAAKVNGVWEIVWDGNGAVMCTDLTNYPDFPADLLSECYDSSVGKIVTR